MTIVIAFQNVRRVFSMKRYGIQTPTSRRRLESRLCVGKYGATAVCSRKKRFHIAVWSSFLSRYEISYPVECRKVFKIAHRNKEAWFVSHQHQNILVAPDLCAEHSFDYMTIRIDYHFLFKGG